MRYFAIVLILLIVLGLSQENKVEITVGEDGKQFDPSTNEEIVK